MESNNPFKKELLPQEELITPEAIKAAIDACDSYPRQRSQRKLKRRQKRSMSKVHSKFSDLCGEFVNALIENGFDWDSPEMVTMFEKKNRRWLGFIKPIITNNLNTFDTPAKRTSATQRFSKFVDKFMEKTKDRKTASNNSDSAKEKEKVNLWGIKLDIDEALEALELAGIKTQAKTIKGIEKRVSTEKDQIKIEKLQELING